MMKTTIKRWILALAYGVALVAAAASHGGIL